MQNHGSYLRLEKPDATTRLLAFHHAGGSALSFLPLARSLPADCEPCLFELSGRQGSGNAYHAADFTEACERFLPDVRELVDRPTVFIGHSLGALFAHNLACALPEEQRSWVRTVIVSASRSPAATAAAARMPQAPFTVRTHETLLEDLRLFGGVSDELLEDPDFREVAVTLLGYDLHLADTYVEPRQPAQGVPYQVWYGTEDDSLPERDRTSWDAGCARPPVHRGFGGGHFYLYERPEPTGALVEVVEGVSSAARPAEAGR
ncbi:thioesterase II family protein [Streptomyces sp. 8N706]|uniref:thioesterase II family protein n=1 Tax=Streptomyces sp. 8N706 TaxID=3457416 RepID=UPI003FD05BC6